MLCYAKCVRQRLSYVSNLSSQEPKCPVYPKVRRLALLCIVVHFDCCPTHGSCEAAVKTVAILCIRVLNQLNILLPYNLTRDSTFEEKKRKKSLENSKDK